MAVLNVGSESTQPPLSRGTPRPTPAALAQTSASTPQFLCGPSPSASVVGIGPASRTFRNAASHRRARSNRSSSGPLRLEFVGETSTSTPQSTRPTSPRFDDPILEAARDLPDVRLRHRESTSGGSTGSTAAEHRQRAAPTIPIDPPPGAAPDHSSTQVTDDQDRGAVLSATRSRRSTWRTSSSPSASTSAEGGPSRIDHDQSSPAAIDCSRSRSMRCGQRGGCIGSSRLWHRVEHVKRGAVCPSGIEAWADHRCNVVSATSGSRRLVARIGLRRHRSAGRDACREVRCDRALASPGSPTSSVASRGECDPPQPKLMDCGWTSDSRLRRAGIGHRRGSLTAPGIRADE